ncbi:MAG TPA: PEGA domain-containing protein, partial [Candidatus Saccharimonadales bacterium]|nr:PEGA domain-containing protein [Candidatus Saccharimonadales bacterium]
MLQTHKHSLIALGVFVLLLIVSASVILYAKGYRFGFDAGRIGFSGTGLLVATSTPNGAQVFVNDHLTTATDNTINLAPGEYNVRIFKEGYFPWQKKVKIQKEAVTKAEALLFPKAPTLESLTDTGANNPVLDPTQTRIAFTIASQSARQNGVYVLDLSTRPILTLQNTATQLVDDTADLFSQSVLSWSPDSGQLLASVSARTGFSTNYLLSTGGFNSAPQDVTETLANVKSTWADLAAKKQTSRLAGLKVAARKMITDNFSIVAWSPDETKILYTASQSANLPIVITPRLIDVDTTPEERTIEKGNAYIYDI